jgi:hypothetical protein
MFLKEFHTDQQWIVLRRRMRCGNSSRGKETLRFFEMFCEGFLVTGSLLFDDRIHRSFTADLDELCSEMLRICVKLEWIEDMTIQDIILHCKCLEMRLLGRDELITYPDDQVMTNAIFIQ